MRAPFSWFLIISVFFVPSTSYPTATTWTRISNSKRLLSSEHPQCRNVIHMYTDMMELNEAIRSDSSAAYKLFLAQEGNVNMDTVYLVVAALTQQGAYEPLEDVMFQMRSKYEIKANGKMWEIIIVEASKKDNNIAKKYFNRMLKHGPLVTSMKTYEVLVNTLSQAENWKDVTVIYKHLLEREDLVEYVQVGFYQMLMKYNANRGRWKEAEYWMAEMARRSLKPSHRCYRYMIDACQKGGKQQLAVTYIDNMLEIFSEKPLE
mmetsp:Transcript_28121/g.26977  ORF Transcript_28121/g.26977 Transcript_28121/m.26977 type:complete len:262 (-) Transcript_28121:63-848(-)